MSDAPDLSELLQAAAAWVRQAVPPASAEADGCAHQTEGCAHQAEACTWCPLCQLVAVVRGERPDLSARLLETGTAFAAAVRSVFAEPPPDQPTTERPGVQRIALRRPGDPATRPDAPDPAAEAG